MLVGYLRNLLQLLGHISMMQSSTINDVEINITSVQQVYASAIAKDLARTTIIRRSWLSLPKIGSTKWLGVCIV